VAWYRFADSSNTAIDYTAELDDDRFADTTAFDGTVNGASFVPNGGVRDVLTGANSGAYDFDGVDDQITIDNRLALGGRQQFTVHLQFAPNTTGGDADRILAEGSSGLTNNNASLAIFESNNNRFSVEGYDPNGNVSNALPVSGSSTTVGQFTSVTVTFDTGTTDIFQDGSRIDGFTTGSSTLQKSSLPIELGFNNQFNRKFFDGRIDDVRLYNRALSASEINQIYQNTDPQ
jgi:hypothetical protein